MVGTRQSSRQHLIGCGWFWAWALAGAGAAFSFISFIGVFTAIPVAVFIALLASRDSILRSAFGFLSGVGFPLLYVAWLHRGGPGTTCWQTAGGGGCDDHLDPIPWLVVGVVCLLAGFIGHVRHTR